MPEAVELFSLTVAIFVGGGVVGFILCWMADRWAEERRKRNAKYTLGTPDVQKRRADSRACAHCAEIETDLCPFCINGEPIP